MHRQQRRVGALCGPPFLFLLGWRGWVCCCCCIGGWACSLATGGGAKLSCRSCSSSHCASSSRPGRAPTGLLARLSCCWLPAPPGGTAPRDGATLALRSRPLAPLVDNPQNVGREFPFRCGRRFVGGGLMGWGALLFAPADTSVNQNIGLNMGRFWIRGRNRNDFNVYPR